MSQIPRIVRQGEEREDDIEMGRGEPAFVCLLPSLQRLMRAYDLLAIS